MCYRGMGISGLFWFRCGSGSCATLDCSPSLVSHQRYLVEVPSSPTGLRVRGWVGEAVGLFVCASFFFLFFSFFLVREFD